MQYGVFYTLYERGQSIASDRPVNMAPAEIKDNILAAMDSDSDFLGLIDHQGTTLQFVYDQDKDEFWVEIPLLDKRASHGCWLTYNACVALLNALPESFAVEAFPGFVLTPWKVSASE